MFVWICAFELRCLGKPVDGMGFSGAGVTGICEPPDDADWVHNLDHLQEQFVSLNGQAICLDPVGESLCLPTPQSSPFSQGR